MLDMLNTRIDELIRDLENMKINSKDPEFLNKMLDTRHDIDEFSKKVCETKEWLTAGIKFFKPSYRDKKEDIGNI